MIDNESFIQTMIVLGIFFPLALTSIMFFHNKRIEREARKERISHMSESKTYIMKMKIVFETKEQAEAYEDRFSDWFMTDPENGALAAVIDIKEGDDD